MKKHIEAVLVLENIRSSENVGSIWRTADAAGISQIVLAGYTPGPEDRFGRPNKALLKASLGAEKSVPWVRAKSAVDFLGEAVEGGAKLIAVEQAPNSVDYKEVRLPASGKVVFILGNEVEGVSKETLALCHDIAEIPLAGSKESLNVSVAAGIALFRILGI